MADYDAYLDDDPRNLDQRTPPTTPPLQQGGGADEAGAAEGDLAQLDATFHAAFAIDEQWTMPRNNTYENSLCYLMAFVHNCDFPRYKKAPSLQKSSSSG